MNNGLENTVLVSSNTTVPQLVLAKKIVFHKYVLNLTNGTISDLAPENYHICAMKKIPDIDSTSKWDWNAIKEYGIEHIGVLANITSISINKDTETEPEHSYQEIYNIPMSAYLFSTQTNYNGILSNDWNYHSYNYDPLECAKDGIEYTQILNTSRPAFPYKYWETNYSFSSGYDSIEYKMYNIDEDIAPENKVCFYTQDKQYTVSRAGIKYGAFCIFYAKDMRTFDFKVQTNNIVPVTYCELHKSFRPYDGKLKISWSNSGFLSIK